MWPSDNLESSEQPEPVGPSVRFPRMMTTISSAPHVLLLGTVRYRKWSYQGSPHSVQEEFSTLSHKGSESLRSYLQKVELKLSAGFYSYQEALGKNQLQDSFKLLAESSSSRL